MDFAEQVKSQADIVRTIGEYVQLRKMGARFVGLCPFHTEKTASFNVNPSIGIYKCFGCGVAGDVIKFVQEIESLTFWEALKSLAERNGIPIPQRRETSDAETEMRAAIFEMYEAAARVYSESLFGGGAQEVRDYLGKRGLSASTAQQFSLGYSEPGWENLVRRFGRRYTPEQMEKSGLFSRREDGSFFDRFRGRLMFPIQNESAKTIAFGGRSLRADDEPKYLNSPETAIYKKSSVLYNLHRAKERIRKDDRTVLVEGYMDVIGVYAAGVHNVVASCGTALTPFQVRSMKRHSANVVVNFDPDVAGANATERSIQMLLDEGMHVRVLELEAGLDPDEYIKKHGAKVYVSGLSKASNYFLWLGDRARKKFDMSSAEGKIAGFQAVLQPAIRRISEPLERAAVAGEVADYLGLSRDLVLAEFKRAPASRSGGSARPTAPPWAHARQSELLRSLVVNADIRDTVLPRLQASAGARKFSVWPIIEAMLTLSETDPRFSYESLEKAVDEKARTLLVKTVFADEHGDTLTRDHLETTLRWLDAEDMKSRMADVQRQIREYEKNGNIHDALRLAAELEDLKRGLSRTGPG